ncbi:complement factor H-related 2 isoform X10 [Rattus norvegicus]|uniref:complement factor H-related 2 isoform X10 n=1 Tax=Rattus norvegicus TaxID=10116 RepID=UPI002FD87A6B
MRFCILLLFASIFLTSWLSTAKGEVEVKCLAPHIPNGNYTPHRINYTAEDEIQYECTDGFYPTTQGTVAKCTSTGWIPAPRCSYSTKICGPPPPIENGDITSFPLPVYIPPSSVDYQCQYLYQMQGNKTIICINGDWSEPPKCLRMACKPPDIPNGIYSPQRVTYTAQDEIKFECKDGFYSATQETVAKCTSTGWIPAPKCMKPCEFPQIKNGGLYHERRRRPYFPVPIGNEYSYYCDNGFLTPSLSYWDYLRCTEKGWEPEVPCLKSCDVPIFENAGTNNDSTWFKLNDKINYECHVGYVNKHKHTKGSITCHHDGWSDIPSCYDSTKICGPPPPIANGDTTSFPLPVYIPPSSVEYQCQSLYQLQGNKTIICINGEWSDPPKCLHPCIISIEIMRKHNITFRTEENQRLYYQSGEMQEFKCKNGHHLATTQPLITICINGHLNYPVCTK